MGRSKSHDKLYMTASEWANEGGGYQRDATGGARSAPPARAVLPFDHCALTLQPMQHPVAAPDGTLFDLPAIAEYLGTHGNTHPVTGAPLHLRDLIKVHWHRNEQGRLHCPVTYDEFGPATAIVLNRASGHVYSRRAVDELNLRSKSMLDLVTGEPFTRDDLIDLQDPRKPELRDASRFARAAQTHAADTRSRDAASSSNVRGVSGDAKRVLAQVADARKDSKAREGGGGGGGGGGSGGSSNAFDPHAVARATNPQTGRMAASLTSTSMPVVTRDRQYTDAELRAARPKQVRGKAYVRLSTTHGDLNLELHADLVPRASENFLLLCRRGYYNNTRFHRLIRNFMIQGGDPRGDGTGGDSAAGGTFPDEIRGSLRHSGRGILSMANSGPDTNRSQFFITFKSCAHLDGKHTVFGRVVGGAATLDALERVPTDPDSDRPRDDVRIRTTTVFVDPFADAEKAHLDAARERDAAAKRAAAPPPTTSDAASQRQRWFSNAASSAATAAAASSPPAGVATPAVPDDVSDEPEVKRRKTKASSSLSDFSSW